MKKADVKVGEVYRAKVTDRVVEVRIDGESPHGGWTATNLATGKSIRIKGAQRLRPSGATTATPVAAGADEGTTRAPAAEVATRADVGQRCRKSKDPAAATAKARKEVIKQADANLAKLDAAEKPKRGPGGRARAPKANKPKRTSALDAAAQLLAKAEGPMRCKDIVAAMAEQGLWSSPEGKTPEATLNAAIIREIGKKRKDSRFIKAGRGLYAANPEGGE